MLQQLIALTAGEWNGTMVLLHLLFHYPSITPQKLNTGPLPWIYTMDEKEVCQQMLISPDGDHLDSPFFHGSELVQTNYD